MTTKAERREKKWAKREAQQLRKFIRRGHYSRAVKRVLELMPPVGEGPIFRAIKERYGSVTFDISFPMGSMENDVITTANKED
jgi:hypothetical protein